MPRSRRAPPAAAACSSSTATPRRAAASRCAASTSSSRARSGTCRRSWRRPARLVVLGDAGDALGNSIYEARLFVRGKVQSLGSDCVEKDMRDEHKAALRQAARCCRAGRQRRRRRVPALRLGAQALQLPHRQPGVLLMSGDERWIHTPPRWSATFDRHTIAEIHRAAATGIYDIRGFGAKRKLPHFDDLLFLGASISRYPLEGYREKCGTDVTLGTRYAKKPITLKIPITIAGMSFGSLSAPAKEALGRGASAVGTSTTTGDGGMTAEERRALPAARLPGAALALRHGPRPVAQGRRHRDRGGPGRQARRRRHAARPEDLRARRRDAHAAAGHRPALRLPPSRLDRPRRPRDQDPRAARDHRLARSPSTSRSARRGPTTTPRWP